MFIPKKFQIGWSIERMRIAAVVLAAVLTVNLVLLASASPSIEELFRTFDLFGTWAGDCRHLATPDNPHVSITMPSPGLVVEDHDLGADFETNRYSVRSAERISATRMSVAVIFRPGTQGEERQNLTFLIRNGTRRTIFNQPEGGTVRVKDGIALAHHVKTPVLRKCD
jgi:hypothetical protein